MGLYFLNLDQVWLPEPSYVSATGDRLHFTTRIMGEVGVSIPPSGWDNRHSEGKESTRLAQGPAFSWCSVKRGVGT